MRNTGNFSKDCAVKGSLCFVVRKNFRDIVSECAGMNPLSCNCTVSVLLKRMRLSALTVLTASNLLKNLLFLLVAGRGFEPLTFGL